VTTGPKTGLEIFVPGRQDIRKEVYPVIRSADLVVAPLFFAYDPSLRALPDEEKPEIFRAYLGSFRRTVQRYFPVAAKASLNDFVPLAHRYPVFEITRRL
jgi:hypothetical protein